MKEGEGWIRDCSLAKNFKRTQEISGGLHRIIFYKYIVTGILFPSDPKVIDVFVLGVPGFQILGRPQRSRSEKRLWKQCPVIPGDDRDGLFHSIIFFIFSRIHILNPDSELKV